MDRRYQSPAFLHSDLNGPAAADCLWCTYVAPCVSIHCCRSLVAVGRRDGCAHSQAVGAALARLWLPAGLHSAAEQQPAALRPERCDAAAAREPRTAPLVY